MTERGVMRGAAALLGLSILFSLAAWANLPVEPSIPLHFSRGVADRFVGRTTAAVSLPLTMAAVTLVILVEGRLRQRRGESPYTPGRASVALLALAVLCCLHAAILLMGMGYELDASDIASFLSGVVFVLIGLVLPRTKPNPIVGLRTRRTLADKAAWRAGNSAAGRALVVLGVLLVVVTPFVTWGVQVAVLATGLLVATLVGVRRSRAVIG